MDVVIIGGGITGLAAAYYLLRGGCRCTLVEREVRLGGVIRTEQADGCVIEAGPDSFISQKPWALELIRELGLEADLIGSNDHLRKTYILRHGRLVPMPDGLFLMVPTAIRPLLSTPLLSPGTKIRMACELLRRARTSGRSDGPAAANGKVTTPARDRSVAEFIRNHYGQEAVDYLAEPLLAGIYGGDAAELSVNSVLPRFVELERRFGSLTRGVLASRAQTASSSKAAPLFLTLKGGMQQLIEALESAIAGKVTFVRGEVEAVESTGNESSPNRLRVSLSGTALEADHVVIATPAYAAGRLLRGMDASLADLLGGIRYHSSITIALGYERSGFRHRLEGFGFLVPKVERRLLTACTWVGTKFPHRVAENRLLLRAFIGCGTNESLLTRSDDALVHEAREELQRLMGVTEEALFSRVVRWRRAMAQYNVGHERRIAEIQGRLDRFPRLHLAGNAYMGIGIPDCIHSAQLAAQRITRGLDQDSPVASSELTSRA